MGSTAALDALFDTVERIFLERQHPVSGLLPASTASTSHGDYTDAWVRDNVYSILGVWGLSRAYRRAGCGADKAYILEQACIRLMRGLLSAMMRQSDKVERFKVTEDSRDALHAKYDTATGDTVVADNAWGHLQVDATSLYLLILVQMIKAGLPIIQSFDEADFIQNLVYYVGRAYRAADYGIWERGHKQNHGRVEINASSVGIAKAALEALKGFNVFGVGGHSHGRMVVVLDEIARARDTLTSLLPAESVSKETDAALLAVIGYPAFAVEDEKLVARTLNRITSRLEGQYGCKRFLRDGHQTVTEDSDRLHYEDGELTNFAGLESEWPLFFAYRAVGAYMRGERKVGNAYYKKLDTLTVERDGAEYLPELYYVAEEHLEAERRAPGSTPRVPNENLPLYWAQSLFILATLLKDGQIDPEDIDPLGRRRVPGRKLGATVRVSFLAQDKETLAILTEAGIDAELLSAERQTRVAPNSDLAGIMGRRGANKKLALTGRPVRRLGSLHSSRIFDFGAGPVVFLPSFFDDRLSYFMYDSAALATRIEAEVAHINRHWLESTDPLMVLCFDRHELTGQGAKDLLTLLKGMQSGKAQEVDVLVAPLDDHVRVIHHVHLSDRITLSDSAIIGHKPPYEKGRLRNRPALTLSELEGWGEARHTGWLLGHFEDNDNIFEIVATLVALLARVDAAGHTDGTKGAETGLTGLPSRAVIETRLGDALHHAAHEGHWLLVRFAAEALSQTDERLPDAAKEVIVRHKRLLLGDVADKKQVIEKPTSLDTLKTAIRRDTQGHSIWAMLKEEMLLHVGAAIKTNSADFRGVHSVNLHDLTALLLSSSNISLEDAAGMAPSVLSGFVKRLFAGQGALPDYLVNPDQNGDDGFALTKRGREVTDWTAWRECMGSVMRVSNQFFPKVFEVLKGTDSLSIGDPYRSECRLDGAIVTSDMTRGEYVFARHIDDLFARLQSPTYRCLNLEALNALASEFLQEEDTRWQGCLVLDDIIAGAIARLWCGDNGSEAGGERARWDHAVALPPTRIAAAVVEEFYARKG